MSILLKEYWGPKIWLVLHTLIENIGRFPDTLRQADEKNAWIRLLSILTLTMPCQRCSKHYKDWFLLFKPRLSITPYNELQDLLRTNIYLLHDTINIQNEKTSPFSLETCKEYYRSPSIKSQLKPAVKDIIEMFKAAINVRKLEYVNTTIFIKTISTLFSMYSI